MFHNIFPKLSDKSLNRFEVDTIRKICFETFETVSQQFQVIFIVCRAKCRMIFAHRSPYPCECNSRLAQTHYTVYLVILYLRIILTKTDVGDVFHTMFSYIFKYFLMLFLVICRTPGGCGEQLRGEETLQARWSVHLNLSTSIIYC